MVGYCLRGRNSAIFDPAVGRGAFFRAAKTVGRELGKTIALMGTEIHANALQEARLAGLSARDLRQVQLRDFVLDPPPGPFESVVANPPYIRHHRLSRETKVKLRALGEGLLGRPLDGRAGIHIYFLLRALTRLMPRRGRLAFILPADTCEGVFAPMLWAWVTERFRLDAVVSFDERASPFPGVDTNALVFLMRRSAPQKSFLWARCAEAGTPEFKRWVLSDFERLPGSTMAVCERDLAEGLATGLSRAPMTKPIAGPRLSDLASVVRGIATGANRYFVLTRDQVERLELPARFLVRAIGRTRDVATEEITKTLLSALDAAGRPTFLLSPDGRPEDLFPAQVRGYLEWGERQGLPQRPLIASRKPWYKMETRRIPPFLFAYLGRRNARFIRNRAGVVPLTGFLCVYPRRQGPAFEEKLWAILRDPRTVANLNLVGKSYGSGCIKVEPRALERLPLPREVVDEVGIAALDRVAPLNHPDQHHHDRHDEEDVDEPSHRVRRNHPEQPHDQQDHEYGP